MNKQGGFTIIEGLIAVGIAAIVVMFALVGANEFIGAEVKMRKRVSDLEDLSLIKLKLGLGVGGGNLRLFFWTGNGPMPDVGTCTGCSTSASDRLVGRLMIPFPNKCRDLTSTCDNGVALMIGMPSVNRTAPYALCMIGGNRVLTLENRPAGPLIALVSPPNGSLFIVTGPTQPFGSIAAVDVACLDGIRRQNNGVLPPGPYFFIPVEPAIANFATGGSCVCNENRQSAVTEFPVRITNVDLYSIGLSPEPGSTELPTYNWGMTNCVVNGTGPNMQFNCDGSPDFAVHGVQYVEVDQQYRVVNLAEPQMWYSLNPNPDARFCVTGECKSMPVPTSNMKVTLAGEGFNALNFNQFSLIKQDILRKMRFKVLLENGKVQSTEVQF